MPLQPYKSASSAPFESPFKTVARGSKPYRLVLNPAGTAAAGGYNGRLWQTHVLSNLPFYSVLVPVFAEVSLMRMRSQGDAQAACLLKVRALRNRPRVSRVPGL